MMFPFHVISPVRVGMRKSSFQAETFIGNTDRNMCVNDFPGLILSMKQVGVANREFAGVGQPGYDAIYHPPQIAITKSLYR
jgi:hypothetical protein